MQRDTTHCVDVLVVALYVFRVAWSACPACVVCVPCVVADGMVAL